MTQEMNVVDIKIHQIKPHPLQESVYGEPEKHQYQELVEDIKRFGIRQPLELTEANELLDGHSRLKALKELGYSTAPAIIVSCADVADRDQRFLMANMQKRQLDVIAKARILKYCWDIEKRRSGHGYRPKSRDFGKHLAGKLGLKMSGRNVERYLELLNLPLAIQNSISNHQLTMSLARDAVKKLNTQQLDEISLGIQSGKNATVLIKEQLDEAGGPVKPKPTTFKKTIASIRTNLLAIETDQAKFIERLERNPEDKSMIKSFVVTLQSILNTRQVETPIARKATGRKVARKCNSLDTLSNGT